MYHPLLSGRCVVIFVLTLHCQVAQFAISKLSVHLVCILSMYIIRTR